MNKYVRWGIVGVIVVGLTGLHETYGKKGKFAKRPGRDRQATDLERRSVGQW